MKRLITALAAAVVVGACSVTATATASTQPVTQCAAGQNPCAGYQDGTPGAIVQDWVVYDSAGAPIVSVPNAGGLKVYGDNLTVYAPGSVTQPVFQVRTDGTILVGGQLLTPRDVRFVHCLEQAQMTAGSCRKAVP